MKLLRTSCSHLLTLVALGLFGTALANAQQPTSDSSTPPSSGGTAQLESSEATDDQWHIALTPYLWVAGMHGPSGLRGFDTSVHASAWDLLKHFDIGLMGTTELRRNRIVLPVDLMWVRLSDDHALPINR